MSIIPITMPIAMPIVSQNSTVQSLNPNLKYIFKIGIKGGIYGPEEDKICGGHQHKIDGDLLIYDVQMLIKPSADPEIESKKVLSLFGKLIEKQYMTDAKLTQYNQQNLFAHISIYKSPVLYVENCEITNDITFINKKYFSVNLL